MILVSVLVAFVAELVVGWHPCCKANKHLQAMIVGEPNWPRKKHDSLLQVVDGDIDLLRLQVLVSLGVSLASQRQHYSIGVCWELCPDEVGEMDRQLREKIILLGHLVFLVDL